ncbi:Hypothetical Protein FCC1311_108792 [Hondaea fermentalgiana]|uniref:Uncharacterized protein n=1 Tax=Hondaea fermentalgiana TaxID=2315210 RepID=A0A2R5GUY3_9STRA|nr:Hypothetical Protein FCC1311_108792 [Hondaea fermentalgiana]|eukprot:GBG34657.1 Hypothetical Protein FCC1311_108792 [Hondaea fermentalgiana]
MKAVAAAASVVVVAMAASTAAQTTTQCEIGTEELEWGSSVIGCGTVSVSMGGCCGTALPEAANATSTDEAICRSLEMQRAYCENEDLEGCDNFKPNATHAITFEIDVTYADAEDTCCSQCKCYGDPLCEAFDGSRDQMIECDARNFTDCGLQQDICRRQFDHAGNRCKWLKGNDNYPWWVSNLEDGSPCQADYEKSGQLELVLVEVGDFKLSTLIGERGVQTDVLVKMAGSSDVYSMSSEDCFDNDPRNVGTSSAASAWDMPTNASAPAEWSVETPNSIDVVWHVGDASVGIYADVVCTKASGASRTRLDIENITDTQGLSGNGYCYTGVIKSGKQRGSNVGNTQAHYDCLQRELPSLVSTCKALTSDSCSYQNVAGWQQYWCETAELEFTEATGDTYADLVTSCLAIIRNGTEDEQAAHWDRLACQMNSGLPYGTDQQDSSVTECLDNLNEFGFYAWTQKYEGIIPHEWTVAETCVSSIEAFTDVPADDTCASGLLVEVNKGGSWEGVLYFPPESPPCADAIIEANGADFPDLFLYPIRLRQCGLSASCLVTEGGTECRPVMSIDATLDFSGSVCTLGGEDCSTCARDLSDTPPQVCEEGSTDEYVVGYCEQCCSTNNYVPGQENQTCRDLEISTPFCDMSDDTSLKYCKKFKKKRYNGMLTINFTEPETSVDDSCCSTCALWGDPFGQAFDGSRQKLIVCDSRDATCLSQEELCGNMVDHKGNACVWNQTVADLIGSKRTNIAAYGSPCLPDWSTSGEDEVVLYTIEDPTFRLSFYTGERSILDLMLLTTPNGEYSLDPEKCFATDPMDGWSTLDGEDVSTALNLTYTANGVNGYGKDERVWSVLDPATGIFFRVTCVFSEAVNANFQGGYRLNVESLVDTELDRTGTDGYCVTSDLVTYGGGYTENPYAEVCEEALASDHLACKAFWAGSCTPEQIALGVESWCKTANQPDSVSKCVRSIKKNKSSRTAALWTKAVCTALLPMKQATQSKGAFLRECQDLAETEAYYAIVENYGSAGDRASVQSYCASSVTDYSKRDSVDPCIGGISVQYDAGQGWEELFFVPSNLMPCDGSLEIPAYKSKYWPLFAYPIRFEQCDVLNEDGACPATVNVEATCMANLGFELSLTYSYDGDIGCPDDA